jgi:hypothetical protein
MICKGSLVGFLTDISSSPRKLSISFFFCAVCLIPGLDLSVFL